MGMCFESEMNFWSIDDFHYSKNNDGILKNTHVRNFALLSLCNFLLQAHLSYYLCIYMVLTFVEEINL